MNKSTFLIALLTLIIFFSFVKKDFDEMVGTFSHKTKEKNVYLELKPDSTFYLVYSFPKFCGMTGSRCNGKWKFISSNQIELSCLSSNELLEQITVGYMKKRTDTIFIKNKRQIYLEENILKRKKQ